MGLSETTNRAWSFNQSIGVDTHIGWEGGYAISSVVEQSIAYLGATHVRDGIPYTGWTLPVYQNLARTGVKFDILASGPTIDIARDVQQATTLNQTVPGSVVAMEGANEFNTQNYIFNGESSNGNPAWAQSYGSALYTAVKAAPALAEVAVIAPSMANAGFTQIQQEGNLAPIVDSSNWHVYYGSGAQPAVNLQAAIAAAQSTAPGKSVTITESGYYTAVDAMDWGGGGVTPAIQAILEVNILLDAFRDGAGATYLYELMDNTANPASTDLEDNFGLFLADGTPKPAATGIHNLTTLLADTDPSAATFTTVPLAVTLTGLPPTGSSIVLEKSNGDYDLVVWNEPKVWDQPTKSAATVSTVPVTLDLGATYQTVKLYDPLKSTTAFQVLTNVRLVNLSLLADPLIIQLSPNLTPQVPPAPITIGSGPDTLALQVSEDAWQGDAQFVISVDGAQVGGTMSATASHAVGQSQLVNVLGRFGAGSHTVTVNFLNDAYAGTASTDRNLYVGGATVDGIAASGATLTLLGAGPQSFSFNVIAQSPTISLANDTGALNSDKITLDDSLTGVGIANATVTVSNGPTVLGRTAADSSGKWNYTPTGLASGDYIMTVSETNSSGYTSTASLAFTLDNTTPKMVMALKMDTGLSSTDRITSSTALTGGGDAGAIVTIRNGSSTIGTTTADSSGHWSFTPTGLADGAYTLTAAETDAAGNTGTTTLAVTLDTKVSKPVIKIVTGNSDGGITLSGVSEANNKVTVTGIAGGSSTVVGTTTSSSSGTWQITTHTVVNTSTINGYAAIATDVAGNSGSTVGQFFLTSTGADTLTSNAGVSDVFAIMSFKGSDVIKGFETTTVVGGVHDFIDLSGRGITSFSQVQSMMSGSTSTIISIGSGKTITLNGITPSQMSASDFVYS